MSLANLIRGKASPLDIATATPATVATHKGVNGRTVAIVATVAVANHKDGQTANLPEPANDHELVTRHYRWLVHFPERDPVHTCCLPEPTHAEVMVMYPEAIAAEPMPEHIRHQATPEQEAELRALVAAVGVVYAFTHSEQQEALALALSDPDAALQSYRAMAAELGNDLDQDDRRHCGQCANLRRDVCTIAEPKAGALVVANRGYRPMREPPRRCAGYAPGPDDPDKRTGRERWPGLF